MLFTTPTQYLALAVALIAGWLFGLASHPGGKKWKARYTAERDTHAATTKRAAELERENARLAKAVPVVEERVVPARDIPVREIPARDDRIVAQDAAVPPRPLDRPLM